LSIRNNINFRTILRICSQYVCKYFKEILIYRAETLKEANSNQPSDDFKFQFFKEDERFLTELFENLKNTELEIVKRRDMFLFLREYISFLHGLQQAREPLYQVAAFHSLISLPNNKHSISKPPTQSLYNHGILFVVEIALTVKDEKVNTTAIEIFSQFVEVVPTLVREFILKEVESRSSLSSLSNRSGSKLSHQAALCTPNASFTSNQNTVSTTPVLERLTGLPSGDDAQSTGQASSSTQPGTSSAEATSNKDNGNLSPKNEIQDRIILPLSKILNIEEDFEPVLINFVIRQMINDPDEGLAAVH